MLDYFAVSRDIFRDVTDNKTSDKSPMLANIYNWTNSLSNLDEEITLCREEDRVKTFENRWPLRFMDTNTLAKTGMYYLGSEDTVKCYFCGVEIGRWEDTDDPIQEHIKWSPNCPLLMRRQTNNVPLDNAALDSIIPPATYDVCGATEAIDVRPAAFAESTISSPGTSSLVYPDHPDYAIEAARLRSFTEWPRTMKQKPQELAEAGFFYTGIGDRVKCFSCGGGLKDWDETDDPWEQHALWLGNCPYLKLMKGKEYIDSVIVKYSLKESVEETECEIVSNEKMQDGPPSATVKFCDDEAHNLQDNLRNNTTTEKNNIGGVLNSVQSTKKDDKAKVVEKVVDDKLCKICYSEEYNTAFWPCGHVVACAKCASSVSKCPLCRKPFTNIMRVYFS